MMKIKTLLLVCLLLAIFVPTLGAEEKEDGRGSLDVHALFFQANKEYDQGNYAESVKLYEKILATGFVNGHLYFNLGNAYFRKGEMGKAILYYRKAGRLIPRNQDLRTNLRYAKENTKDSAELDERGKLLKSIFFWYSPLTFLEQLWILIGLNFVFWSIRFIRIFVWNEPVKWGYYSALLLLGIFAISTILKGWSDQTHHSGVVLTPKVAVLSGNGVHNTPLFYLHEGAEFGIVDEVNDWLLITTKVYTDTEKGEKGLLAKMEKGWVEKKFVGVID
jgi:tetratricopeptide (TPR) repeat protein